MENPEFTNRLKLFIRSKGLGQAKFEEFVGFSRGYISKVKPSIGADKLLDIVNVFPELNLDWLIRGKGKMTDPSVPSNPTGQLSETEEEDSVDYKNQYLELLKENRSLRRKIEKLRKTKEPKRPAKRPD